MTIDFLSLRGGKSQEFDVGVFDDRGEKVFRLTVDPNRHGFFNRFDVREGLKVGDAFFLFPVDRTGKGDPMFFHPMRWLQNKKKAS